MTKSDNAERAARAITFLSDSQFFRQPLPDKVDSAVEVASQSKHRQVRLAVAESLQIFKLRQSDLPMLLRLLDDANEDVWHAATNGLLWQQTWVRQGESKLKLIESLERHAKQLDEKLRARNQIIQDIVNRKAEFDWVDWPN